MLHGEIIVVCSEIQTQHINTLREQKVGFLIARSANCEKRVSASCLSVCMSAWLKCDGTRAETRFRLSAKRTRLFKSAGASVQSTTGSRDVRISGSNAGYTMFRRSVKGTGYPLHSPVSPSLPLPCVTVCHHISTGLYLPGICDGEVRMSRR